MSCNCKHGHPLTGDNVRVAKGRRHCRACDVRRHRESKVRRRAMQPPVADIADFSVTHEAGVQLVASNPTHSIIPKTRRARIGIQGFPKVDAYERFFAKVSKGSEPSDCWIWLGAVGSKGYGRFWVDGRMIPAHRYSYELAHGTTMRNDLNGCHSCDTPRCVNPAHIWPGTQKDNMLDAAKKGRLFVPPRKSHCKRGHALTSENTRAVRGGGRCCIICQRMHVNQSAKRRREAAWAAP